MAANTSIRITEIGPRDGLQGEPLAMPTAGKIAMVRTLSQAGLGEIEATAFVHPKWIPNLADAEDVLAATQDLPAIRYALVPNERGLVRALATGVQGITTVFSATDGHNRSNLNRSTEHSLQEAIAVGRQTLSAGRLLRASISTVFGCPFDPTPAPARIVEIAARLREAGYRRVGLCDTIGVANPAQVGALVSTVLRELPDLELDLHFHDTYGRGLANVVAALEAGVTSFDSSIGGLGGCPYAPGATGNISTEDLVAMLHAMGLETGVDADALFRVSEQVAVWRGRVESQCWRVEQARRARSARLEHVE